MRALALLGWCCLSAALACSAEDLGDDPVEDDDDPTLAMAGRGGSPGGAAGAPEDGEGARGGAAGAGGAASDETDGEGQPTPGALDDGAAQGETGIFVGMTAAHNAARAALDIDPPLPELTWSTQLAAVAQDWADTLTSNDCGSIAHRMPNMYGENIAMRGSSRLVQPFSPEDAVAGWDAEVACWDYGTISRTESCDMQCAQDLNSNGCGHYTQLVWRNTRQVGCGYSTCADATYTYEVWVCNYDPPGNFIGQTPY
jgi:pathogenesis-related protein 1